MVAEPPLTFTPASSWLRVRRSQAANMTAGGIHLPETAQRRPAEGTVVAVGPGRALPGGHVRTIMWNTIGDLILFQPADFHEITNTFDGLVRAEKVVATLWPDGYLEPENDYVKINPAASQVQTRGGVILPEESRERALRGVILDYGGGELRLSGPLTGTRRSVHVMMGISEAEELTGRTCWWAGVKPALQVGGDDPCLLVHAADIFALEDP
jgi:chaperonin GroES